MPHFHLPNPFRSHKPSPSHSSSHKRSQSQPRALAPPTVDPTYPSSAAPVLFSSSPASPTSSHSSASGSSGSGGSGNGSGRRLKLSRAGNKRDSFGCLDSNRVVSEEGERRRQELRTKRSEASLFRRAKGQGHERGGSIPVVRDFAFDVHLAPPGSPQALYHSTYTPPPATPAVPATHHTRHQRSSSTPGRRPATAPSAVDTRRMPKSRSAEERVAAEARAMEILDDRAWRRTGHRWE